MAHILLVLALSVLTRTPGMLVPQDSPDRGVGIDFPGGTVGEYVDVLRKTYKQQDEWGIANIVVVPDAEKFLMPPVQLQNVDVGEAVNLLRDVSTPPDGSARTLVVAAGGAAFTVRPLGIKGKRSTDTFSTIAVTSILDAGFTAEDVLTAVEQMLALMGEQYEEPRLRFHEATGLLIGYGAPEQMQAMERVVYQLQVAADQRSAADVPDSETLQAAIRQLQERLEASHAETLAFRSEVVVLQARSRALEEELQRAYNTIERMEIELREVRRRNQRDGDSSNSRPQ